MGQKPQHFRLRTCLHFLLLKPASLQPDKLSKFLERIPHRDDEMEGPVKYFLQEYKIACADEEYENVLTFVRALEYEKEGLFLKDIDVTMDYAGSFDKEEVAISLVEHRGFQQAASRDEAGRTIVINDHHTVSALPRNYLPVSICQCTVFLHNSRRK